MTARGELPRAERPRASILIPAFGAERFASCLDSLARTLGDEPACEVIAVINGIGEPLRTVGAETGGLRTLDPPVNLGFAAGLNLARAAARGEYLVVLQDDTVVHPSWLESLVAVADAHPEAGIVCSAGLYPGGGTVQTAGVVLFSDATATHVRDGEPVAALEALEPYAADSCSSAGMLVRARTWDAVGGLDDRFFPLYFVDATLTMCVWERGESVLCAPRARVEHARSQSTSSRFKDYLFPRHRRVFEDRWRDVLDARHEAPDDHGPEATRRALERAQAGWRAARAGPAPSGPAPAPYEPDGAELERLRAGLRYARRALEIREDYSRELEATLDAREAELREREREALAAESERAWLRERADTLAAIQAGGWWRLRGRLLPLVRLAGRLRRQALSLLSSHAKGRHDGL